MAVSKGSAMGLSLGQLRLKFGLLVREVLLALLVELALGFELLDLALFGKDLLL